MIRKFIYAICVVLCTAGCSAIYAGIGLLYEAAGSNHKAIEYFRATIADDCECEEQRFHLARLYRKTSQHILALEELEHISKFSHHNIKALLEVADILISLGDHEKAISKLSYVLRLDASTAHCHYALGRAYMGMGQWDIAAQEFSKELELNPDHEYARISLNKSKDMLEFKRALSRR